MWKAFQRYRALDPLSRSLFRQAVLLLPTIAISLRFRGFKSTKEALQKDLSVLSPAQSPGETTMIALQKTSRMVLAAAHHGLIHPTCLAESLALWYLLQKQRVPASLRIGVRKVSEKFEAHAWVEHDGTALNQPDQHHQHYAAFDSGFSDLPEEKP
ncbi:MAG TPA: lasso peptide biosynthesis B2 protein [Candidatus Acidoferrum sp.]|jgi:hypothetical protein|nr:lasso peptide biosynthesis B2 protein [Candidatus Acidoferrum sp.]